MTSSVASACQFWEELLFEATLLVAFCTFSLLLDTHLYEQLFYVVSSVPGSFPFLLLAGVANICYRVWSLPEVFLCL